MQLYCVYLHLLRKNKPDLSQIKDVWNELKILLEKINYYTRKYIISTTEEIFVKYLKSNFELGKNILEFA